MKRASKLNWVVILSIAILIQITGCSGIDMTQYRDNNPPLDPFSYFHGTTKGWGIVQDRKGVLTRQFSVDIVGTINESGDLVLEEHFDWSDGEKSTRTWTLSRINSNTYLGTAADVVGNASGMSHGNVLNWKYQLNLEVDGSTWKIQFDDWMFLVSSNLLLNRAELTKFGFRVGEVTIVFDNNHE